MNARTETNADIKIRKNPEAWSNDPANALIPNEVAEEWRNGKLSTLEFPMAGKVALEHGPGHVHWVPNIKLVPQPQRLKFYQAMIGYWGSINDYATAQYVQVNVPDSIHSNSMTMADAIAAFRWRISSTLNFSLVPLTDQVFQLPKASPD